MTSVDVDFDAHAFGSRLRAERERLQLSQQAAADRCGVRREMWGKYERGTAEPGVRVLARLGALGADVLYLLLGRHELQMAEGEGLIRPVEIASVLREVKLAFDREGVAVEMYELGTGELEATTRYMARLVNLAAEIYNELRTLAPGADYAGALKNMTFAAAITERGRFVAESGAKVR